jgi:hypothetical protein
MPWTSCSHRAGGGGTSTVRESVSKSGEGPDIDVSQKAKTTL